MKAYFISGLAADRRVFKYIQLPERYEVEYLDWIPPRQREKLSDYSLRLAESINASEPFVIVGLSMGGMIAIEIAKIFNPGAVILISSIPVSTQLPGYFRIAGRLRLHKMLPLKMIKSAAIMKRLFTSETPEDKILLREIIRDSDPHFIRWAIEAILGWKNDIVPRNCIHIHGTRDEILPLRFTKPTYTVYKGDHLLVMTKPHEINTILYNTLNKYPV